MYLIDFHFLKAWLSILIGSKIGLKSRQPLFLPTSQGFSRFTWPLSLLLLGLLMLLFPMNIHAGGPTSFEAMILQGAGCGDGNEIGVSFNNQMIRSDRSAQEAQTGEISVSISPGEYEIKLTSFDEHGGDDPHAQEREQWYVEFRAGDQVVATSGTISDLPNTHDWLTETVNERLSIGSHVDNVVAYHAAFPDSGIHSIIPMCVGVNRHEEPKASIGDRVWLDNNKNGIQDEGELGLAGVSVHLFSNGTSLQQTVTDGNGFYRFTDLPTGTYTIKVDPLPDYHISPRNAGDAQFDSNIDANGWMSETTLEPSENDMSWDAGLYQDVEPPMVEIVGFAYCDENENGTHDAGEAGLASVQVTASNSDREASVETNEAGQFSINNLPEGSYDVQFNPPAGYHETTRQERSQRNWSVGFVGPCGDDTTEETASIGNYVWLDFNKNGTQDSGENAVAGVTLKLWREGEQAPVQTTVTDGNGYYLFSNVKPGAVYLQIIVPANYSLTHSDQGGNNEIDSDFNPENNITVPTMLEAGEADMSWDAGLIGKGKPDACARFNLDLGRNALTGAGIEGRYEMIEVGSGSLLASWDADFWWADSGWIEGIELAFRDGSWVEVFFYPNGQGPAQKLEIINPAPGTTYGWLAPGICHAIEIQFPVDWAFVQSDVAVAQPAELVAEQPVEPVELGEIKDSTLLKFGPEQATGHCDSIQLPNSEKFLLC